jgi:molybdopterin-guanine dinucleotide biosynthesis protein B
MLRNPFLLPVEFSICMLLGIAGLSNTGKTELVTSLVSRLGEEGMTVVTIKHVHEDSTLLPEGKDTTRHLEAGAASSTAVSNDNMVTYRRGDGSLDDALLMIQSSSRNDVILVEGFKGSDIPKVVLGDVEAGGEVVARGEGPQQVIDEAMAYIRRSVSVERAFKQLAGLDCGKCGFQTCWDMAQEIADGKAQISDCKSLGSGKVRIMADGRLVSVGPFVEEIVSGTVLGMVRSLKGAENTLTVTIEINTSQE